VSEKVLFGARVEGAVMPVITAEASDAAVRLVVSVETRMMMVDIVF
jgi:hypothetical protein